MPSLNLRTPNTFQFIIHYLGYQGLCNLILYFLSCIMIVIFGFIFLQCVIIRNMCYLLPVSFPWNYSITISLQKLAKQVQILVQIYVLYYLSNNKPSCSRKSSSFPKVYIFHKFAKSHRKYIGKYVHLIRWLW